MSVSRKIPPSNFDEMDRVNERKRKLLKRSNLMGLEIIMNYKYTLLMSAFEDPQLYFSLFLYFVARCIRDTEFVTLPPSTLAPIGVVANLFSFLLVFYLTQSYNRFTAQYDVAMAIEGRIFESVLLARSCMSPAGAWRHFRYLNAAHLLGYVGLGDIYTEDNLFTPMNHMYALLSRSEVHRIKTVGFPGGGAYREILAWAIEGIRQQKEEMNYSSIDSDTLTNLIFQLRSKIGTLYDYADQPLPYSYIHFINFMVFLFLPIFSYCVAVGYAADQIQKEYTIHDSLVGFVIVFLYCMISLVIRTLAQHLQDPMGVYGEDLSVLHYIRHTINASRRVLCALNIDKANMEDEEKLIHIREKAYIDDTFGYKDMSYFHTAKMVFKEYHSQHRTHEYNPDSPYGTPLDSIVSTPSISSKNNTSLKQETFMNTTNNTYIPSNMITQINILSQSASITSNNNGNRNTYNNTANTPDYTDTHNPIHARVRFNSSPNTNNNNNNTNTTRGGGNKNDNQYPVMYRQTATRDSDYDIV